MSARLPLTRIWTSLMFCRSQLVVDVYDWFMNSTLDSRILGEVDIGSNHTDISPLGRPCCGPCSPCAHGSRLGWQSGTIRRREETSRQQETRENDLSFLVS